MALRVFSIDPKLELIMTTADLEVLISEVFATFAIPADLTNKGWNFLHRMVGPTTFPFKQSVIDSNPNNSGVCFMGKTPALFMIKLRPPVPQRAAVSSYDWSMDFSSVTSS